MTRERLRAESGMGTVYLCHVGSVQYFVNQTVTLRRA